MKKLPKKITTVYAGDRVAIYFDDDLADEGPKSEMSAVNVMTALGIESESKTINSNAKIIFPANLSSLFKPQTVQPEEVAPKKQRRKKN